jgi:adenylate cyclase
MRHRRVFFWRIAAVALVVATVPLLGVGWRVQSVNQQALAARVRDHQAAIAVGIAGALERTLGDARASLGGVALALVDERRRPDERLAAAAALIDSDPHIDHVGIYDATGALIDVLRREGAAGARLVAPTVDPLAIGRDGRLDELRLDDDGVARVRVAAPVRASDGGRTTGLLVTWAGLAELQGATARLHQVALGGAGDALVVVDARGRMLAQAPVGGAPLSLARSPVLDGLGALSTFSNGFVRYGEVDDGGAGLVATVVSLPVFGVGVVVSQDQDTVYASLAEVRRTVGIAVVVAIVVALLLSLVLARRLAQPVGELARFAERLGRRQWSERVAVVGNDELTTLAEALNGAAADLSASEQALEEERRVRAELRRFVPGPVVERLQRGGRAGLEGHAQPITVLFADVVDFSRFASTRAPEDVVRLLNELFSILTEVVFRHGGTVDKFTGDGVMAFWGAPEPVEDHAARAVRAARDMLVFVEAANETWRERYGVDLQLAIGVNTGTAVVGAVGSASRLDYTAIGGAVNVAAALERMARPRQVLCAASTTSAIGAGAGLAFFAVGERAVAGYETPIPMFALSEH